MITSKKTCKVCGKEFIVLDIRSKQKVCGNRSCKANYEYQKRHYDPYTGYKPDMDEIKKW